MQANGRRKSPASMSIHADKHLSPVGRRLPSGARQRPERRERPLSPGAGRCAGRAAHRLPARDPGGHRSLAHVPAGERAASDCLRGAHHHPAGIPAPVGLDPQRQAQGRATRAVAPGGHFVRRGRHQAARLLGDRGSEGASVVLLDRDGLVRWFDALGFTADKGARLLDELRRSSAAGDRPEG